MKLMDELTPTPKKPGRLVRFLDLFHHRPTLDSFASAEPIKKAPHSNLLAARNEETELRKAVEQGKEIRDIRRPHEQLPSSIPSNPVASSRDFPRPRSVVDAEKKKGFVMPSQAIDLPPGKPKTPEQRRAEMRLVQPLEPDRLKPIVEPRKSESS